MSLETFGTWGWPASMAFGGLLAGGLANRCVDRLPEGRAVFGREAWCSVCGQGNGVLSELPFVRRYTASATCSRCRARERSTSTLVRVLVPALWVVFSLRGGPSVYTAASVVFVTALVVLAAIDYHHYLLPDCITLPFTSLGVAATQFRDWPVTLLEASLSAGLGYFGMMALAYAAESYYGEEALGQGDWKMVAMIGAMFGPTKLMLVLIGGNALGAVVGLALLASRGAEGRQKLPLGTFLGVAAVAVAWM